MHFLLGYHCSFFILVQEYKGKKPTLSREARGWAQPGQSENRLIGAWPHSPINSLHGALFVSVG